MTSVVGCAREEPGRRPDPPLPLRYGTIVIRSSTSLTPGAAHAACVASCRSAHECTFPDRTTLPSSAATLIRRASISALRLRAASILDWTSLTLTCDRTAMLFVTPMTPALLLAEATLTEIREKAPERAVSAEEA